VIGLVHQLSYSEPMADGGISKVAETSSSLELRSLQRQIHDHLLGKILAGELLPGERIAPPDLATSLGVSITPVRDAINLLAAEGLVSIQPRRGTIVAPVSANDIVELYEIRLMIEPAAAQLAAERASNEQLTRIRSLAERLESPAAADGDAAMALGQYMAEMAVDADFHAEVVRAAGNRRLSTLYEGLRAHVLVARTNFPTLSRRRPHRRGEHLRVVTGIEAHNGEQAREAMVEHLQRALADTLRRVSDTEAIPESHVSTSADSL
jgi:DNA-binding GntR family transcriptional regulator